MEDGGLGLDFIYTKLCGRAGSDCMYSKFAKLPYDFIYTKNLCAAEIGFYLHREFRGCAGLLFKKLYIH